VKGKIVLVMRHEPGERDPKSVFAGMENTKHSFLISKAIAAQSHGAAGMLLVTDPNNHKSHVPFSEASMIPKEILPAVKEALRKKATDADAERALQAMGEMYEASETIGIPCAHVSLGAAEELLEPSERDIRDVQKNIDTTMKPDSFEVKDRFAGICVTVKKGSKQSSNVVGYVEGSDENLKKEVIVIGGHYDHVGRTGKSIFYGADDNASGTAVVMEVAEAFGKLAVRPKRSVLFIAFSGEEKGFLGSMFYLGHPVFPVDKTVCMINLDMVGRGKADEIYVMNAKTSPQLAKALEEADARVPEKLSLIDGWVAPGSDHFPFYERSVPVAFFNCGMNPDMHSPGDTVDKIVPGKMRWVGRLVFDAVWTLADDAKRPEFVAATGQPGGQFHGPMLGVTTEVLSAEELKKLELAGGALRIKSIVADTPAEKCGLKAGDIIIEFDGKPIPKENGDWELRKLVVQADKDKPTKVVVLRNGEKKEFEVKWKQGR
jgi:aminopeptidase YwaD